MHKHLLALRLGENASLFRSLFCTTSSPLKNGQITVGPYKSLKIVFATPQAILLLPSPLAGFNPPEDDVADLEEGPVVLVEGPGAADHHVGPEPPHGHGLRQALVQVVQRRLGRHHERARVGIQDLDEEEETEEKK